MLSKSLQYLWGDLSKEDIKKYGMLSLTFLFIIGTYWLMRPLKDALFMKIVGKLWIPYAKMASFVVVATLILCYSKLVDLFKKHQLFYVICSFYALVFFAIAYFLTHPTIGLANTAAAPTRALGWIIYLGIESFGSLTVPLFWSFVASTSDQSSAKRGYSLIIAGAQVGAIAGPTLATYAEVIGMPQLAAIVGIGIATVIPLIVMFTRAFPSSTVDSVADKKSTGFLEGLKLLFTKPYLIGILGVATLYEVVGTILDYQMKFAADEVYHTPEKIAQFLGLFAQSANTLALLFALIGTSFFIRRFGLTFCLVMFPLAVASVVMYVWLSPPSLWALFGAMVTIKGLSYALNNPCKEIMYIPTSKDVKFKAKGWIDGFGGRSAKAGGSYVNSFFTTMTDLMFFGSMISLGIIGIWIIFALYVGKANQKLNEEGKIVS